MILAWMLACAEEGGSKGGASAGDYSGPVGRILEYADPLDETHLTQLTLVISETSWELTDLLGTFVTLPWTLEDGLVVDDQLLLPDPVIAGSAAGGVAVGQFGPAEVYYGIFPQAVTTERADGSFAGPQTWAEGVGPVALTWGGAWELVYYE